MKKSFLTVCFVVLVFGLMFSLSSCQKKQETETGAQPGVSDTTTAPPAETGAPAPEMTPAPGESAPAAPSTEAPAAPAPAAPGSEVPAPPADGGTAQ